MHDSAASNLLSFSDTLTHVFTFSEDNTCMTHTDNHVGEAFNTPLLDEFMALYNTVNSASLRIFAEVTVTLLPNTNDGKLLLWAQRMVTEGICPTIAPKILAFLQHKGSRRRRRRRRRRSSLLDDPPVLIMTPFLIILHIY
jgi:hypothetical protein